MKQQQQLIQEKKKECPLFFAIDGCIGKENCAIYSKYAPRCWEAVLENRNKS